ncbi:hypothetical protein CBR_g30976 [Chara braunii]|uniref:Granulins domain-containing protein n=1 Tax=Chara braunii TaxID=69332 RepID=A0A388LDY7_CHABU|nr:hypothetical protein CBR_g30972 [Chara braunii]GBG80515.1 hypothetical protein CBR_g30976 [Chara braunii]|eukprot:GBG80511.1 hypothetical protein CBR_g30972 [Chara braunii]
MAYGRQVVILMVIATLALAFNAKPAEGCVGYVGGDCFPFFGPNACCNCDAGGYALYCEPYTFGQGAFKCQHVAFDSRCVTEADVALIRTQSGSERRLMF